MSAIGRLRWRLGHRLDLWAYRGHLPRALARRRIGRFWEDYARPIHEAWGTSDADFAVLASVIQRHGVRSVLDVGCGSGRLFRLYQAEGVERILGVDIAAEALKLAAEAYPGVPTRQAAIEDLPTDLGRWDLAVSNRVLQHVPEVDIARVVNQLAGMARLVYINELSDSDPVPPEFFMRRYDYPALFAAAGCAEIESGLIGEQTWRVFRIPHTPDNP